MRGSFAIVTASMSVKVIDIRLVCRGPKEFLVALGNQRATVQDMSELVPLLWRGIDAIVDVAVQDIIHQKIRVIANTYPFIKWASRSPVDLWQRKF